MQHRVALLEPVEARGPGGVTTTVPTERYRSGAQFIYARGSEAVEAARLEGRPTFKVKLRSCAAARAVTTDWRLRDVRQSIDYAIVEADTVSDRQWVWLTVQGGNET
ncbi:head-tail adaptor protein [Frigidibacter sp. MR17.24]